jgi:hypothetical protein
VDDVRAGDLDVLKRHDMDLPSPRIVNAQAVLGLPVLLPLAPDIDEILVKELRSEFPNIVLRQPPLMGAQNDGPRLILTSTSSQLVISASQAEFEVRFYGDYSSRSDLCLSYVQKKLEAIRNALAALDLRPPALIGVVMFAQFSFKGFEVSPIEHLLSTHLRVDVDPATVGDTVARVAVKVRDKYFATFRVADYEVRTIQRPVMPNQPQPMLVKAWEGSLEDYGVSLTIDINNALESRNLGGDPTVSEAGVSAILELLSQSLLTAGPKFVATGELHAESLVGEPA